MSNNESSIESSTQLIPTDIGNLSNDKIYTDEEIHKYRNMVIKFIDGNKSKLAQIYLTHFEKDGPGLMSINLLETVNTYGTGQFKVDVLYIKNEVVPADLLIKIAMLCENNNENIIYILMSTPAEERLVEMDIRNLTS